LRVAAGATLISQGIAYFNDKHGAGFLTFAIVGLVIALGCLLLIGFWTRVIAALAAIIDIASVFSWFPGANTGPLGIATTAMLAAAIAVAVICLGAGALSIDARVFGRREILIPASAIERESDKK
jgi:uncharacterized membrane protein YphA (DoxX/SURF4 family)